MKGNHHETEINIFVCLPFHRYSVNRYGLIISFPLNKE